MSLLRLLRLVVFVGGCVVGCGPKTPPKQLVWSKHEFGGGRYVIEVEALQPSNTSSTFHLTDSGEEKIKEEIDLKVGDTNVHIDMGKLSVNGSAKGEVANKDHIKVFANGDVTVNGEKR
jgi:hypothetical protein